MPTLTTAQALITFLSRQYVERDGERSRFFAGVFGIFGHGNVAGVGQALLQAELAATEDGVPPTLPYVLARNEQAMVHAAVAYARHRDRTAAWACTASVGPGSTNMLTGAALATINRLPVLLLPSSTFAGRAASPLLQELEDSRAGDVTVNDAFRPLSRYYDNLTRPEQLIPAALQAMRVLTDPAETGAVTLSLPQDVQAEAYDWPEEFLAERTWRIERAPADPAALAEAAELIKAASAPLIIAGGGVHYSGAEDELAEFAAATGIPVAETQAGKGSLLHGDPRLMGAVGATGTTAANALARDADLVIGIGTRWSDFSTASRTLFANPDVRFVNLNVAAPDAAKQAGLAVRGDAREAIRALRERLAGVGVDEAHLRRQDELRAAWDATVDAAYAAPAATDGRMVQSAVLGIVNEYSDPGDTVVCAAGSMPGDLHKLWRVRDRHGYHVEYGYSCMGYEVPGGLGIALADPDRDVFAMVGDGSWLMMSAELATAVQERVKIIVVLVQNHGFGSIGALSESLGSQRFGTSYRRRGETGRLDAEPVGVDLAANAASLGATVITAGDREELINAIAQAKAAPPDRPVVITVETDPTVPAPDSAAWWDVPVSEVAELASTREAYQNYRKEKENQRPLVAPPDWDRSPNPGS
ncbi:3D-(3,5/4)-trihydroxycyclohexane-1,2-dione acylhydrolase (decyclizing) [Naumannella huperziae]